MNFTLVVVRPFADYLPGTVVSDQKAITDIQKGEHADCVVKMTSARAAVMTAKED